MACHCSAKALTPNRTHRFMVLVIYVLPPSNKINAHKSKNRPVFRTAFKCAYTKTQLIKIHRFNQLPCRYYKLFAAIVYGIFSIVFTASSIYTTVPIELRVKSYVPRYPLDIVLITLNYCS